MNRKAFELTVTAIILFILGFLVLIGLVLAFTGGLEKFRSSTKPFLDTTEATSVKEACRMACNNQEKITFCCGNYTIQKQDIKCYDPRLEISCSAIDCETFECGPQ